MLLFKLYMDEVLVRNAIDHGIELPDDRVAAGKSAAGSIHLSATQQGGNIVIVVSDDGAGLNRDRILAKAREKQLLVSDSLTDQEVWQVILEPGFSTAEKVTEVSGRGVGMDVVRKNVHALGGRIEIESAYGIGTRITVRLPLTLAILDGMSVALGSETYVIPLNHVVESLQPNSHMAKSMGGAERLLHVRGEYLPLIRLHEVFDVAPQCTDVTQGIVVILEADGIKAALLVDALVGEQQVVIKSLEANYRRVPGIAAATIMGDGRVGLILDVAALVARTGAAARKAA
jgi:two-component system chemotaxis sensor kinase CheA